MLEELEKDDPVNLSLAIDLAKKTDPKTSRLLVFQTRKAGLGALFSSEYLSEDVRSRVHAFGALEDIYSLDVLLHEPQDVIARALHQDYLNTQEETGHMPRSKPALFSWEELEEKYRDSNRRAADHIDVKLRSIGLEVKPLEGESLGFFDNDPRVELLAQMEHESWSADTLLQGYTYGRIRDEVSANKKHDCLLPWDSLSKDTKEWDRKQILAIPRALKRAGMGIYPAEK
jgi:hypothetical protein